MPSEFISKLTDSPAQKLLPEWAYLNIYRRMFAGKNQMNELRRIARDYETIGQEQSVKADGNPDFIMDMIQGDFDKVSVMDFTKALLQSAPNMAAQVGLAVAGAPLLIPAYIGGSTFSDKYFDISENHQDMTGAQKWTNIILSSANEALLDMVTAKIAGGFTTKKSWCKKLSAKGLLKYLGKSVIQEGSN